MALTLPTDRAFIIAEAGTNHLGLMDRAMDYVNAAAGAGADAVKFQWFTDPNEPLFCPLPGDDKRWWRWSKSILTYPRWHQIKQYAEAKGLVFLASTFQHTTVAWLDELGVVATKVASRAAKTFPYKDAPPPYFVSLGMFDDETWDGPTQKCYFIECESKYPSTDRWCADAPGFSDHSGTPWRAIDAISRGCKLIEVHYHLDERDAGPDLPASLTLDELELICEARDGFADLHKG